VCLRFAFLLVARAASWLRLSRREETWKTAEILILRHQLAVLQRRQPRRPNLNWADRALLAALLGVIPKARRQGLRLLVTPDTILRWHRRPSQPGPDKMICPAARSGASPPARSLAGCQKSASPLNCSDAPGTSPGHDDQLCPSACFT
jgi:hypothetical protein